MLGVLGVLGVRKGVFSHLLNGLLFVQVNIDLDIIAILVNALKLYHLKLIMGGGNDLELGDKVLCAL